VSLGGHLMTGHVAIVDDDESVRRAMTRLLQAHSFMVHSYSSGRKFLDSLNRGAPACLILDMQMDGMRGLELLQHLVGMGFRVPTIVLTADDDPVMRDRCKRAGAVAFLAKPVNGDSLLEAIRSATATGSPMEP